MNVRRVLRIAAVAAWGIGLSPMLPTFGQASSPTLDAMGWWNKTQALPVQGNPSGVDDPTGLGITTAPTVPAPATVPEDGLYVANDASGATAISAVRYLAGGGGTLTLKLASGATATGTEAIAACPVLGGFTPAQNGRWDAKPGYDEATCTITGTIDTAAGTVTFELPSTLASSLGDIGVVIAPAAGNTTPFSLAFAKPDDTSFVVTAPTSSSSSGSSFTPSTPAYTPGSPVFSPSAPSSSFSAPAAPTASAPAGGDEVAAAPVPVEATPAAVVASDDRTSQVAAVAIMLAIGGALWWLSTHPQRAPRLLGSVGGAAAVAEPAPVLVQTQRPRGVGRFSRPRDVPATPL